MDRLTLVVGLVAGCFMLVNATLSLVAAVSAVRAKVRAVQTQQRVNEIHVLVNDRMSETLARVNQLTAALQTSDTEVPASPYPREGRQP